MTILRSVGTLQALERSKTDDGQCHEKAMNSMPTEFMMLLLCNFMRKIRFKMVHMTHIIRTITRNMRSLQAK